MLKTKKNTILKWVEEAGHETSNFEGIDAGFTETSNFTVRLKNSPLECNFLTHVKNFDAHALFVTRFVSQYNKYRWPSMNDHYSRSWSDVEEKFKTWLKTDVENYLKEFDAPDLWDELAISGGDDSVIFSDLTNDEFNDDEKDDLKQRLDLFRLLLLEKSKDDAIAIEEINKKIDHLKDAVDRLGRFDWKGLAAATLMSLAVATSGIDENTKDNVVDFISRIPAKHVQPLIDSSDP